MDARECYAQAGAEAGCPADQLRNFRAGDYVAQPLQLRFHAYARAADVTGGPTEIAIGGARGPGKSHAIFAQLGIDDCQRRDNLKTLYLRKAGKKAREQLDDLARKVLFKTPHVYRRQAGLIEFPNGSRIIAGHFRYEADIDDYLGLEYDIIAVEEATTLTKTKFQALRDSCRTSRDDWRARIYNSTNPGGVGHAWYKQTFVRPWRKAAETFTRFIFGTIDDNAYISQEYRDSLERNTGWRLRAYRYGDWDIAAGQFFTTWRRDEVVREFEPSPYWRYWLSMDYGFQHYTVVYLFAEDGDGQVYVVDEHREQHWLPSRHAGAIKAMLSRRPSRFWDVFVAGADVFANRGETTIGDQYKALGLELTAAQMDRVNGAAEILKRLGDPDEGIKPTVTIHPRCVGLIETLPVMEHNPRRPEDVLKVDCDEEGNGGDDCYDAFRYGLMEGAHKYQPPEVVRYA